MTESSRLIFDGDYPMAHTALDLNRDLLLPIDAMRASPQTHQVASRTDAETLAIRETTSEQIPIERSGIDATIGAPVVLLTDFGTAGAAELFAAALTDADRAESVGLRTAGRAAEQTLVPLPDGGGLLLSSVRYLTASGDPIHRAGVEPAVVAQPPVAEFGTELGVPAEDPMLDRALEHLADIPAA